MFRAEQERMVQETNIQLVNIRQDEILYFNKFFTSFGTQCFLLGGFISGALSQTPVFDTDTYYFFVVLYDISTAICFLLCMQSVIVSLFVTVFGQGLALRGPPGSMVKAIEGMVIEQKNVLTVFCLSIAAYIGHEIGMYFVMMDTIHGAICSAIIVISGFYTYKYCVKIYNRFHFDEKITDFHDNFVDIKTMLNPQNELVRDLFKKYSHDVIAEAYNSLINEGKLLESDHILKKKKCIQKYLKNNKKISKKDEDISSSESSSSDFEDPNKDKYMNYLTVKIKQTGTILKNDPWERRYAVINSQYEMSFYKDDYSFKMKPEDPINRRPIDLEGYSLLVDDKSSGPYFFSLVTSDPDDVRKGWIFRVDTQKEFTEWIDSLSSIIKECNKAFSLTYNSDIKKGMTNKEIFKAMEDDEKDENEFVARYSIAK